MYNKCHNYEYVLILLLVSMNNNSISLNISNPVALEVIQVGQELAKLAQSDEKTLVHQGTTKKKKSTSSSLKIVEPKIVQKVLELIKKSHQVTWNANDRAIWTSLEQGLKQYIVKHPELETDKIVTLALNKLHLFSQSVDLNYDIQLSHLDDVSQKQVQQALNDEDSINMFLSIAAFEKLFFDIIGKTVLTSKRMREAQDTLIQKGGRIQWKSDEDFIVAISQDLFGKSISFDDMGYVINVGKTLSKIRENSKSDIHELTDAFCEVLHKYQTASSEKKPFYAFLLAFIIFSEQQMLNNLQEAHPDHQKMGSVLVTLFNENFDTLSEKFLIKSQGLEALFPALFKGAAAYVKYIHLIAKRSTQQQGLYNAFLKKAGFSEEAVIQNYQEDLNKIHAQDNSIDDQFNQQFLQLYDEYARTLQAKKERYDTLYELSRKIFLNLKKSEVYANRTSVRFPFSHMISALPTVKEFSEYVPATLDSQNIKGVALQIFDNPNAFATSKKNVPDDQIAEKLSQMSLKDKKIKQKKTNSESSSMQQEEIAPRESNPRESNKKSDSVNNNSANTVNKPKSSDPDSPPDPHAKSRFARALAKNAETIAGASKKEKTASPVESLENIKCSNHVWRWFDPSQNPFVDDENYATQELREKTQKWLRLSHEVPLVVAQLARQNSKSHDFVDSETQVVFDAYTVGAELESPEFGKKRGVCTFGFKKGTNELCHSYFSTNIQESQMIMDYLTNGFLRYDFPTLAESCEKARSVKKSFIVSIKNSQVAMQTENVISTSLSSEFSMPDGKSKLRVFF